MRQLLLAITLLFASAAFSAEPQLLYRNAPGLQPMSQDNAPSCVGAATAKALEILHPDKQFSAEWIYGQCRQQFDAPYPRGAECHWAAHCLSTNGCVPSADYSLLGVDLTTYSAQRAIAYGERGPPASLLPIANQYVTAGYTKVTNWDTLVREVTVGRPVIVGSAIGFGPNNNRVRDKDGGLRPRWWSVWRHAMVIIAIDDKGALLLNSWGPNWISGPKRYGDEPGGSFWASRFTIERILGYGDSYSIHAIKGL